VITDGDCVADAGVRIEKSSYYYSLRSGPLHVVWDEQSTWYIEYDRSATGRESTTFSGLCGNYDGDPLSKLSATTVSFVSCARERFVMRWKIGAIFRTGMKYSGDVRSSGSKPSLRNSWHGILHFRRFIYFLSGFCFRSEFCFRNNISSTTFPCA